MKRIISIVLLICTFTLCLSSCGNLVSETGEENGGYSAGDGTLSISERESAAKNAVVNECVRTLRSSIDLNRTYAIDLTTYRVGNITHKNDKFTVYITFSLYDNYGKLKKKCEMSKTVTVDEYGNVEGPYVSEYDFK